MTETTAAQNKAMMLHNSRNPRALHEYLNKWRAGMEVATTDYLLGVIQHFSELHEHTIRPDFTLGPLVLKFDIQRALWHGTDVDLTITEFKIVKMLADLAGNFQSYRAVYDCMHYAGFQAGMGIEGYKTNVRSAIKRLRRKFEALDPKWDSVENYNGFGYRWLRPDDRPGVPRALKIATNTMIASSSIITPIDGKIVTVDQLPPDISAT